MSSFGRAGRRDPCRRFLFSGFYVAENDGHRADGAGLDAETVHRAMARDIFSRFRVWRAQGISFAKGSEAALLGGQRPRARCGRMQRSAAAFRFGVDSGGKGSRAPQPVTGIFDSRPAQWHEVGGTFPGFACWAARQTRRNLRKTGKDGQESAGNGAAGSNFTNLLQICVDFFASILYNE